MKSTQESKQVSSVHASSEHILAFQMLKTDFQHVPFRNTEPYTATAEFTSQVSLMHAVLEAATL